MLTDNGELVSGLFSKENFRSFKKIKETKKISSSLMAVGVFLVLSNVFGTDNHKNYCKLTNQTIETNLKGFVKCNDCLNYYFPSYMVIKKRAL